MLVGGGTGGHILPLLAVAAELKARNQSLKIIAVIDKSTRFAHLLESSPDIDEIKQISAGKFRRYPNRSLWQALIDLHTLMLNIRDAMRTFSGLLQAIWLLRRQQPSIIFIKGGFVGVPVGCAARLLGQPFITHDSDASSGLANRIIARWARLNSVAMDASLYGYDAHKIVQVGVPVSEKFAKVTTTDREAYRQFVNVPVDAKLILVTGGSQGAKQLNMAIFAIIKDLMADKSIYVIHQTGSTAEVFESAPPDRYQQVDYIDELYKVSGAADVIIARAGSAMAEFAAQSKAVIAVPAPHLAAGHQLKNARILKQQEAAMVLQEAEITKQPEALLEAVRYLLNNSAARQRYGRKLHDLYPSNATKKIADLLLQQNNRDHRA